MPKIQIRNFPHIFLSGRGFNRIFVEYNRQF